MPKAKGILRGQWVGTFKKVVGADLSTKAAIIAEAFRRCMTTEQPDPRACLRTAAAEAGLGPAYVGVYAAKRPELKYETATKWHAYLAELGEAIRATVKGLVAEEYRRCMATRGVARDCYARAARERELGKKLMELWEITEIEV